jgi:antirestriction protein
METHGLAKTTFNDNLSRPAVYVGTYAKYNNGSIEGAWVYLDDFTNEEEFYAFCHELHKDEEDPELMYQDFEEFPKRYYSESYINSDLWEWLALDDNEKDILEAYLECFGFDGTIEDAMDAYQGQFDNDIDFTMELLESCGDIPKELPSYIVIDWEATARTIMYDYSSHNDFYFRA